MITLLQLLRTHHLYHSQNTLPRHILTEMLLLGLLLDLCLLILACFVHP